MSAEPFVLTVSCADRPGIVAALSKTLFENGANIVEADQFDDTLAGRFFSRIAFNLLAGAAIDPLQQALRPLAAEYDMAFAVRSLAQRPRLLLLVSRFDHCLVDLLYRWRTGELAVDIAGIVANHPRETYAHIDFDGIAFDHLPVTRETKPRQEAEVARIVEERRIDLVVLARYMQVLSDDLSRRLAGRCINIHHSFLPAFVGAKPYHQAHARGVKLIGATAHYVTSDLDEGPIIEQDVERIAHHDTPETLVRKGREIERRVLSRAVAWHVDSRIILDGHKTIVFRD